MVRGVVGFSLVLTVVQGMEGSAHACSPLPDLLIEPYLSEGALTGVPTDGVLGFRAGVYGDLDAALGLMSITVTQGDAVVPGAIETVSIDGGAGYQSVFVVWRPEAAFAANTDYVATVAVLNFPDDVEPATEIVVSIATADGPGLAFPEVALAEVELAALAVETGRTVCCEGDIGSCGPTCVGPELTDRADLTAQLGLGDEPALSQVFVRTVAGPEGALDPAGVLDVAARVGDVGIEHRFDAPQDAYCIGVELVSLIDGSVSEPTIACLEHGALVLDSRDNPGLDDFVAGCEAPYYEDTGEPYVPDGADSGSSSGSDDGGASGIIDTADGSSGNIDNIPPEDGDARGCACDAGGRTPTGPGLAMLVIAGLVRRRRVRTAR